MGFIAAHISEDYEDFKFKSRPLNFIIMRTMRSLKTGGMQLTHVSDDRYSPPSYFMYVASAP